MYKVYSGIGAATHWVTELYDLVSQLRALGSFTCHVSTSRNPFHLLMKNRHLSTQQCHVTEGQH